MWPFAGSIGAVGIGSSGVFLTDKFEFVTGGGINLNQNIKFFNDGAWGEAGFAGAPAGGSYNKYSGQWWSGHPASPIGASYQVRCESESGPDTWDRVGAVTGTWTDIGPEPAWGITVTGGKGGEGEGESEITAIFQIRLKGGSGEILAQNEVHLAVFHT